jgi:adenosylhomocysteinase
LREEGETEIFSIFAKPYSIDNGVLHRIERSDLRVIKKSYKELETTDFIDKHLQEALSRSREDKKQIAIIEVGGYFAEALTHLSNEDAQYIAGVIEDTTFGHNRYQKLIKEIPVPVFSVARSALKEIEARFVGRDAIASVDMVLRKEGVSLAGRHALVIGYGMIGKNVARTLQAYDLKVSVYDKLDYRNLQAFIDGFHIHKKNELLKLADIIFSATGDEATSLEQIEECKNGVILASVGSKDTEFAISALKEVSFKEESIGEYIVKYHLPHSKHVMVIKDGTAVNFLLPSLPAEIIDLVFSEIFFCLILAISKRNEYPPGHLHTAPEKYLDIIAKAWLRDAN